MMDFRVLQAAIMSGLLLLGAGYARAADRTELAKMQAQMLSPVVQLEHNCSGTVIYSGPQKKAPAKISTLILTAKHCIDGVLGTFTVNVPVYQAGRVVKEEAYKAKVRGSSASADLALVELIDDQTVFADIVKLAPADLMPIEGEDVWTVGYSRGMVRTVTQGLFGSRDWLEFEGKEREYFRATPQIAGGNSGGVLFHMNDAGDYQQAGVTVLVVPQSDFIGLYVPIDQIHAYLKKAAPEMATKPAPAAKPWPTGYPCC